MFTFRTWLLGAACSAFLCGPAFAEEKAPPAVKVTVNPAAEQSMAQVTWASGSVVSRSQSRVAAEIEGKLVKIAEVGDRVQQGDVIAKINDQTLLLEKQSNEAELSRLTSQVALVKRQVKRLSRLAAVKGASKSELDEKVSELAMVEQELQSAKVALAQTEYQLSLTRVVAPFSGIVAQRLAQVGEYSQVGSELLQLIDLNNLEVSVKAPLESARYLKAGDWIFVKDSGKHGQGEMQQVRTIVPAGINRSRLMEVRVALTSDRWLVGSAVRVAVPASLKKPVTAVHRDALIFREGGTFVYIVDNESKAKRINIKTGIGDGDFVEVIGDIHPGDQAITRGAERLKPGQSLHVVETRDISTIAQK